MTEVELRVVVEIGGVEIVRLKERQELRVARESRVRAQVRRGFLRLALQDRRALRQQRVVVLQRNLDGFVERDSHGPLRLRQGSARRDKRANVKPASTDGNSGTSESTQHRCIRIGNSTFIEIKRESMGAMQPRAARRSEALGGREVRERERARLRERCEIRLLRFRFRSDGAKTWRAVSYQRLTDRLVVQMADRAVCFGGIGDGGATRFPESWLPPAATSERYRETTTNRIGFALMHIQATCERHQLTSYSRRPIAQGLHTKVGDQEVSGDLAAHWDQFECSSAFSTRATHFPRVCAAGPSISCWRSRSVNIRRQCSAPRAPPPSASPPCVSLRRPRAFSRPRRRRFLQIIFVLVRADVVAFDRKFRFSRSRSLLGTAIVGHSGGGRKPCDSIRGVDGELAFRCAQRWRRGLLFERRRRCARRNRRAARR